MPRLRRKSKDLTSSLRRFFIAQGLLLTANDKGIAALKDRHRGQRCFILGNGPSLKISDLDRLKEEVTFASNKIYLAFENTEWRPSYYSVSDVLVAQNNSIEIDRLNLKKIFEDNVKPFFKNESALWLRKTEFPTANGEPELRFSLNALEGVYGGWTVVYLQMQLAFYMGIREIYLLGMDFSFEVPESTGEICDSGEILTHQGEINHFHPDYRKPGEKWTMPLLDKQREAFEVAKTVVESQKGKVFNASRTTKLEVFPTVDFDLLLR